MTALDQSQLTRPARPHSLAATLDGALLTFSGIDPQWPMKLRAVLAGRPWLQAWAEQILDDARAFSTTPRMRATGWALAPRLQVDIDDRSALSAPLLLAGTVLTNLASLTALQADGLADLLQHPATRTTGHSAGLLSAAAAGGGADSAAAAVRLALVMGVTATAAARNMSALCDSTAEITAMAAIAGPSTNALRELLTDGVELAVINAPGRHVVSGRPEDLERFRHLLSNQAATQAAERKAGRRPGAALRFTWEYLATPVPFHHSGLSPAVAALADWDLSLSPTLTTIDPATGQPLVSGVEALAHSVLAAAQDWAGTLREHHGEAVLAVGANNGVDALSRQALAGSGSLFIATETTEGRTALFTPGAPLPRTSNYARYAPTRVGDELVTAHTRLTGKSPFVLAGMTPTTVDAKIVAAAANAGHVAELAGGGQVTEAIFTQRMAELGELLTPGTEVVFNALHLDPYLWDLHLGAARLVQKARAAGAPICGVTISAGIPDRDVAVALLDELNDLGIWLNALKPGTSAQVRAALDIAEHSEHTLWLHVEGGQAGGHHSWEDLETLLLDTYHSIREHDNVVLAVGGGVGTPERADELLSGRWSLKHGAPAMPVDAILLGTVTMACAESTASTSVKRALAATTGPRQGWVQRALFEAGMTSGLSGLSADIHFLDNAASRTAALLDEVAGDTDAVVQRRDEIVAALAGTAKPYFGDVETMTYGELLTRFVDLTAIGDHSRYHDGAWLDVSHRNRFADLIVRTQARLHPVDEGQIRGIVDDTDDPWATLAALAEYPLDTRLHPADADFFLAVCRRAGKPLPFVPVIDADVRRWYQSDALWQSHSERYDADQVLIIPGPAAVAGITAPDEPVADLVSRFTQPCLQHAGPATEDPVLTRVLRAPVVNWAGRVRPNPLRRIGQWEVDDVAIWTAGDEYAVLRPVSEHRVELEIGWEPLTDQDGSIRLALEAGRCGIEVVDLDAVHIPAAPAVANSADAHASVIGSTTVLPDATMRGLWPDIFAALEQAAPAALLDLVHASHRINRDSSVSAARVVARDAAPGGFTLTTEAADGRWTSTDTFFVRQPQSEPPVTLAAPDLGWHDTGHLLLGKVDHAAPTDLDAFALVTGDLNPIHRCDALARFVGLPGRIVHGMWTSATGQRVAIETACHGDADRLVAWEMVFTSALAPGSMATFTSTRTGVRDGQLRLEVLVHSDDELIAIGTATVAAPRTAYVFPGQGIQHVGMGMQDYVDDPAARAVWDAADAHCRSALGFSILEVVRDNPTELAAAPAGEPTAIYRHPAGVLFLTQFTQVAMATLASAQVAQMRAAGVFDEDAVCAGHSVGEYNALAAVTGTLELEDLIELVFARGTAMHHLVDRDEAGASDFRLAVIRPHLADLDHGACQSLVDNVAADTGQLCQIVNHNLRGKQYAVAGTIGALSKLADALGSGKDGKAPLLYVPGIDVPFHSTALRGGVAGFRKQLERHLPATVDPTRLVGRYVPNLHPRPFEVTREYVEAVRAVSGSTVLADLLTTWEQHDAARIARVLLVELLAHQFAMPVRWIETMDVLCGELDRQRIVEVGVGAAPTLANLAKAALALPSHTGARPQVLNLETDSEEVFARTSTAALDPEPEPEPAKGAQAPIAPTPTTTDRPTAAADRPIDAAQALRALVAIRAAVRTDQLDASIEDLVDGASSRRNQVLMDLGKEFGISGMDGVQDLPLDDVAEAITAKASGYRYPGPVLSAWLDGDVNTALNRNGITRTAVSKRLTDHWGLGEGWTQQCLLAVGLGTRQGQSKRGGELSALDGRGDELIDLAVREVAQSLGIDITPTTATASVAVDAAAVKALEQRFEDLLANAATSLLTGIRPTPATPDDNGTDEQLKRLADLDAEFGAARAQQVRAVFDPHRHWHLASANAWARASIDHLVHEAAVGVRRPDLLDQVALFRDHDPRIRQTLQWYAQSAIQFGEAAAAVREVVSEAEHRTPSGVRVNLAELTEAVPEDLLDAAVALSASPGSFAGQVALVTGASPNSIAEQAVAHLLRGSATVVLVTSSDSAERIEAYRELERTHAGPGAQLHVVRANLASFSDVDAVLDWLTTPTTTTVGPVTREVKPALWPTLLLPFAAAPATGSLADTGTDNEVTQRLLSLGVQRLIGSLGERILRAGSQPVTVILPLSPNHGTFGGDGSYGDAKAALETVLNRWYAEQQAWAAGTRLIGAQIGWVRGTGLMAANDAAAHAVERALGVRTFSAAQMGALIAAACTLRPEQPLRIDLTAGLSTATGIGEVLRDMATQPPSAEPAVDTVAALPGPHWPAAPAELDASPSIDLDDMVVIAGVSEIGPWGRSQTRWQAELGTLNADAITELAWRMGLITWDADNARWSDADGEALAEADVATRLRDAVGAHVGIRVLEATADIAAHGQVTLLEVYLEQPLTIGDRTYEAGTAIRVPATRELPRQVGGQFPTGIDPVRHGIEQGLAQSIDPLAAWNLVVTAEALASAGVSAEELGESVHASRIGNVQGTGMGGAHSLHKLYVDPLLGTTHANDLLQEALGNVVSAHVNQSLIGGYGPMVHPVAACATAAVSLEEAVDKIRLGKADILIAGGLDDLSTEGITGFADMAATADNAALLAAGIPAHWHSRPGDRRRAGFVESQGGASMLVVRGSVAARMGLPVRAVVAYAGSFGDGVQTSIPAPGLGTLAAAHGGPDSALARALRDHGLTPDDIAVVSKHDTSTQANDPNEALIHATISEALGRTPGNPLRVVSQKSVTGHAKGGAAGWQLAGLCDVFQTSTVPGNRPLVSVDPDVTPGPLVVDYRPLHRATPVRAAVLTSLGFGHVSALVALAHPGVFEAAMPETQRAEYRRRSAARRLDGAWSLLAARYGRAPVFSRRTQRPDKFDEINYLIGAR